MDSTGALDLPDIPNKVNLIPFNEHEGCGFKAPTRAAIDAFHKYLIDRSGNRVVGRLRDFVHESHRFFATLRGRHDFRAIRVLLCVPFGFPLCAPRFRLERYWRATRVPLVNLCP